MTSCLKEQNKVAWTFYFLLMVSKFEMIEQKSVKLSINITDDTGLSEINGEKHKSNCGSVSAVLDNISLFVKTVRGSSQHGCRSYFHPGLHCYTWNRWPLKRSSSVLSVAIIVAIVTSEGSYILREKQESMRSIMTWVIRQNRKKSICKRREHDQPHKPQMMRQTQGQSGVFQWPLCSFTWLFWSA